MLQYVLPFFPSPCHKHKGASCTKIREVLRCLQRSAGLVSMSLIENICFSSSYLPREQACGVSPVRFEQ